MNREKPPLLFVSLQEAPWGGSEWLWSETALWLAKQGEPVSFVTPWRKDQPVVNALRASGAAEHCVRTPSRWYKRILHRLGGPGSFPLEVLKRTRPTLVVVSQGRQDEGLDWVQACLASGVPHVILNQYATEHLHLTEELGEQMAEAFTRARACWFVSKNNAQLVSRQLGIPLPEARLAINPSRVPVDAPYTPPESACLSLALVGRLDPETKGQDLIFEVLSQGAWRQRALDLHVYGSGSAKKRLRRLAALLGLKRVHFEGYAENPADIWRTHHVVCQPSRGEGTPIAMVEGMLMGRPVLGTQVAGIPEWVSDGETGFLAESPSPGHLNAALERLWTQRAQLPEMGRRAQQVARQRAGVDPVGRFARELLSLRDSLARSR